EMDSVEVTDGGDCAFEFPRYIVKAVNDFHGDSVSVASPGDILENEYDISSAEVLSTIGIILKLNFA
ncbi:MAG: hypothetical protein RBR16_06935, partial [Syntrophus sp. (in: bacteria)]|nr:hypothetical protein [Syntrophus sp. (in: bacteria)]